MNRPDVLDLSKSAPPGLESPSICLVYLTHNRIAYTKRSLPRLLEDSEENFELVIWDNGSTDGTQEYLRSVRDRRLVELVLRPENEGQAAATNWVWRNTAADLCGKVDNDCLVSPGWTRILGSMHREVPRLGAIGCWHFMLEDFDLDKASHKLRSLGSHRVLVNPHIGGSAFLTKRADYLRFGPIDEQELSVYWWKLALHGRTNGWYYPLIPQEHMDDPRSPFCMLPELLVDGSEGSWIMRSRGLRTRAEYSDWLRRDAKQILIAPAALKMRHRWRMLCRDLAHRLLRQKSDSLRQS